METLMDGQVGKICGGEGRCRQDVWKYLRGLAGASGKEEQGLPLSYFIRYDGSLI